MTPDAADIEPQIDPRAAGPPGVREGGTARAAPGGRRRLPGAAGDGPLLVSRKAALFVRGTEAVGHLAARPSVRPYAGPDARPDTAAGVRPDRPGRLALAPRRGVRGPGGPREDAGPLHLLSHPYGLPPLEPGERRRRRHRRHRLAARRRRRPPRRPGTHGDHPP